jgi:putative phosphoesterase
VIAVIADTHLPRGTRRLPNRCVELIAAAEGVIHAGDVSTAVALAEIEAIGPPVHAVHGNVDEPSLQRLPASLQIELAGCRIGVVHDAGPSRGRLRRLRCRFPEAAAVVFGHSHLPVHERTDGFQIFNPGSPTDRRRARRRSMGIMRTTGQRLAFQHIWL